MKKLTLLAALALLVLTPSIFFIRQITLSQLDCKLCRQFASFLAQPKDYNRAIAMVEIKGQESTLNLIPNYVGWYMVEFYRTENDAKPDIDLTKIAIKCRPDLPIKILDSRPTGWPVYSRYGNGTTLGFLFISPAEIGNKNLVHCRIFFNSSVSGNLVVSRLSEN